MLGNNRSGGGLIEKPNWYEIGPSLSITGEPADLNGSTADASLLPLVRELSIAQPTKNCGSMERMAVAADLVRL